MEEFELIEFIAEAVGPLPDSVIKGIGDDAAVVRPTPGQELAVCIDTLVEGVHFPVGTEPESIGHKALAVNLSDLAAMGAVPRWATLALTLPTIDSNWLAGFVTGFMALAARYGVTLVGGDTTRGPLVITVQLGGELPPGTALRRDGAKAGHIIAVSGTLGDAASALEHLRAGAEVPAALRARLDRPEPRVGLGQALRGVASACIDVSDGLLADLGHILAASGVGAVVETERLPRSEAFRQAQGTMAMQVAGGDDYELVFTIPEQDWDKIRGHDVTPIGGVVAGSGIHCLDGTGSEIEMRNHGYEHFKDTDCV